MNFYFVLSCCVLLYLIDLPLYLCVFECIDHNSNHCFNKIHSCRRSDDSFALKREFRTIAQCMDYARERTALAINYSPPDAAKLRKNIEDYLPNCQILGCPDIGYSNMINDSGYDYYSAYKNLSRK